MAAKEEKTVEAENSKLTVKQMDNEAKSMKQILDARPKRNIKIKVKAKPGQTIPPVPVGINGYVYHVPVNVHVDVPDLVADLLEAGDYI